MEKVVEITCPQDIDVYGRKKWQTLYTTDKWIASQGWDLVDWGLSSEEELEIYSNDSYEIFEDSEWCEIVSWYNL